MKNEYKMVQLIEKLKKRNNNAHIFFQNLLSELRDPHQSREALKKLLASFAITQYGNFTFEEEELLGEIIDENLSND